MQSIDFLKQLRYYETLIHKNSEDFIKDLLPSYNSRKCELDRIYMGGVFCRVVLTNTGYDVLEETEKVLKWVEEQEENNNG